MTMPTPDPLPLPTTPGPLPPTTDMEPGYKPPRGSQDEPIYLIRMVVHDDAKKGVWERLKSVYGLDVKRLPVRVIDVYADEKLSTWVAVVATWQPIESVLDEWRDFGQLEATPVEGVQEDLPFVEDMEQVDLVTEIKEREPRKI